MPRNVKISADITREAKNALDEYSKIHDRSRSWLLNRMILKFCVMEKNKEVAQKVKRKKHPNNTNEQFEILWAAKGKKGAKAKALELFKKLVEGADNKTCEELTSILVEDISNRIKSDEIGFEALHLTTYINQSRWEK